MIPSTMTSDDIFQCTQCGECCKGFGGTYMTPEDVDRIAAHIGVSRERFLDEYCEMADGMPVIAVGEDGYCLFFKENCSIHEVKPRMCRAWPFIDAVERAPSNWDLMAGACDGICTGIPHDDIRRIVRQEINKLDAARHEKGSISPHLAGKKA